MANTDLGPKGVAVPNHPSYCITCRDWIRLEHFPTDFAMRKLVVCKRHVKPTWYGWLFNHRACQSCLKRYFLPWEELCSNCYKLEYDGDEDNLTITKVRIWLLEGNIHPLTTALWFWNERKFQLIRTMRSVGGP